ncbi:hypothetical protein Ddye_024862 [Dipteronia dyeriana]|uniref:Uncharacterized protein n=1 Tax=Dipteronia dyeriana TaxID=168575 RepID=A0AAD9TWN4_9ROSI|nr:hypothetical protein Ddye_024862 [Dipteronia dyeriana]
MAQQEEGWPLGLQPLNLRVGLAGNHGDFSGSVSFNTLITGSPTSSTDSSSDLDTESTGSFFHDRSITLGSLIGVSSIFELSKRSIRGRKTEAVKEKKKSNNKRSRRAWLFSLCSRDSIDIAENVNNNNINNPPSLGHFLAVERRAANNNNNNNNNECRRNQLSSNIYYGPDDLAMTQPYMEPNSLFVDGRIAPPPPPPQSNADHERRNNGGLLDNHGNGCCGVPVLFSCMCGQSSSH